MPRGAPATNTQNQIAALQIPFTKAGIPKLLLNATEAAESLSVSRDTLYVLLQRGELKSIGSGKMRRFPVQELIRYITAKLEEANEDAVA